MPQMAEAHAPLTFFFLLVLAAGFISRPAASATCGFNILVKTGDRDDAGTDATVSLTISSGGVGNQLTLPNLRNQGTMGVNYNYFEKGNLDSFSVTSECLPGPPCLMLLSHDNSNSKPGWYVDYVLVVTSTGMHQFNVYQWLAWDQPPYQLAAIRNDCGRVQRLGGGGGDSSGMVLVRTSSVPTTSPKLPIAAAAAAAEATTTDQIHDDDAAAARESTGSSSSS